ncbi:MAG: diaminopimelate dehydrogenase [Peptococcaceae bacterium]|jgi:diaminopimelate dehydrogenase|nr:diaminopimelate dehydrogenase [Peptococcaceae bacterium]
MTEKINVGIVGYGNLGKGAEKAIKRNPDFRLVSIFSRRGAGKGEGDVAIADYKDLANYQGKIDLMLMCGGSATDLPEQVPWVARWFNTVDTFDTHGKIPTYFAKVDQAARQADKLSMISTGWDPGLFSLARVLFASALPTGINNTFWGRGVSQGHSDALRRVEGVLDAKSYTIPLESALEAASAGTGKEYTPQQSHSRECYVVAAPDSDLRVIEEKILTMPEYFAPYDTRVYFVSQETLNREHGALPHGGRVIRAGIAGEDSRDLMELRLTLESNPEFTSSVMLCFARAAWRLYREGRRGAVSPLDAPIGYLSPRDGETLRRESL